MFPEKECIFFCVLVDDHPSVRVPLTLGFASLPFAFAVSSSLLATGLGWVVYRPTMGLVLLTLALAPFLTAAYKSSRRRLAERRHRI